MERDEKKDVVDYNINFFINKADNNLLNLINTKLVYNSQVEKELLERKLSRKVQVAKNKLQNLKNTGGKWGKVVLSKEVLNQYKPKQREYIKNAITELITQNTLYYLDKEYNFRKYIVLTNNNRIFFEVEEYDIVYIYDYVYIDDYGVSESLKSQVAPRIIVIDSDNYKKSSFFNERGFTKEFLDEILKGGIKMEDYYNKKDSLTFEGGFTDLARYMKKIENLKDKCDLVCSYKDFTTYYN